MTKNISLAVHEIVYDTGKVEYQVMTPQQLAGFKRRKAIKKKIIANKKVITFDLQIKTI